MLKKEKGFTMIEIMVAVLVLAIGLLGVAGLQILSMQSSNGALNRSQATMLAYDLAERMRRNPGTALSDGYSDISIEADGSQKAAPNSPNCISTGCTNTQLATQDIREWLDNITDVQGIGLSGNNWQSALPGSTASLVRNANEFTLTINWTEAGTDNGNKQELNKSYEMRFTL
ncbi:type IV pilus modification protein PilV [Endozoicomonas sp. ISHI1]|uniref:type IV pilus modification protein PilV n=1 Tax=Endozoicomonas sp. ISHI1 TaxID=2825882 RepID=UPI002148E02C